MPTVYSKKSLVEKLGIQEGFRILILNQPENFSETFGALPKGVVMTETLQGQLDLIHFFTKNRYELTRKFPILKQKISPKGVLWISWPKESSNVETDLDENVVREIGLKNGLVDVKVISVDEIWSGLKFVYRLKDRK